MLEWKRVPVPLRGINKSRVEPEMDPRQGISPWMNNLLPLDGHLRARRTDRDTGINLNFKELFEFGDPEGVRHLVGIGTDKKLYDINKSGSDLTATELGALAGEATNAWMVTLGGAGRNRIYATTGHRTEATRTLSNIWKWDGTDFAQVNGEGFTSLDANVLLAYRGHLLLADIIERLDPDTDILPYRVRWSHIFDPEEFVVEDTNTAGFLDLVEDRNNSRILSMLPLREVIAVYKEDCIYNMTFKGAIGFSAQITSADRGLIGPKAVAPVLDGNKHLVVSSDNIYTYNGFSFDHPAIGEPIRDWFFKELDWTQKDQVRVTAVPELYEAWISFPTSAGTRTIVWNWKYNGWFPQSADYRCHYLAKLFFDQPTILGSYGTQAGLWELFKGAGVTATTYDIPLQRMEKQPFGEFQKYLISQLTLDADGAWSAAIRSTDNLAPSASAYVTEQASATELRDDLGLLTIDFKRYAYRKYNGLRLSTAALADTDSPPVLREVNIATDTTGRR